MKKGIDFIGVGAGAIVINDQGKVLIAKRGANSRNEVGKWEFPGGGVKFGEKCEDAVKREVKEEFDIEIEVIELLEVVNHIIPEEKQHWVSPSYIAKYISGTTKILEPDKIDEFKWVDISEIKIELLSIASQHNLITYKSKFGDKIPT
jgi:8-oxo-dGTP diphosphatase